MSAASDHRLPVTTTVSFPKNVPSRADFSVPVHPSMEVTSSSSQTRRVTPVRSTTLVMSRPSVSALRKSVGRNSSHGTWMTWRGSIPSRPHRAAAMLSRATDFPTRTRTGENHQAISDRATRDVGEDVRPVAQVALVAGFEESV